MVITLENLSTPELHKLGKQQERKPISWLGNWEQLMGLQELRQLRGEARDLSMVKMLTHA